MASGNPGPGDKRDNVGDLDNFREMRERMGRDRDAFFSDSPQQFFGRESPFFRVSHKTHAIPFSNS
jgi:hypothetical protein